MKLKKLPDFFIKNIQDFEGNEKILKYYKLTRDGDIEGLTELYCFDASLGSYNSGQPIGLYKLVYYFWDSIGDSERKPEEFWEQVNSIESENYNNNVKEYYRIQKIMFDDIEKAIGCGLLDDSIEKIIIVDGFIFGYADAYIDTSDSDIKELIEEELEDIYNKKSLNSYYKEQLKEKLGYTPDDEFSDIYNINSVKDFSSYKQKGIKNFIFVFKNGDIKNITIDFFEYIKLLELRFLDYDIDIIEKIEDIKKIKFKMSKWYHLECFFSGYFDNLDFSHYIKNK